MVNNGESGYQTEPIDLTVLSDFSGDLVFQVVCVAK